MSGGVDGSYSKVGKLLLRYIGDGSRALGGRLNRLPIAARQHHLDDVRGAVFGSAVIYVQIATVEAVRNTTSFYLCN